MRARLCILAAPFFAGCGGGAPLLHPAHVLNPGDTSVGAGLSGQIALVPRAAAASGDVSASRLEELTIAAGVAPWVGGRVGIEGSNEAGLTYSGRAIRIDGRHAFALGVPTLSIGLGASAIVAQRPESGSGSVFGGGADLPILIGITSKSDVYSLWFGPRAGFELLSGRIQTSDITTDPQAQPGLIDARGRHFYAGLVLGARVGFRHLHVALEVGGAYHHAAGTFGDTSVTIDQGTITPGGALVASF